MSNEALLSSPGKADPVQAPCAAQKGEPNCKITCLLCRLGQANKSGSGSLDIESRNGTYSATNISLKNLLANAYGIKGRPDFGSIGIDRLCALDIEAKIVEPDPDALEIRRLSSSGGLCQ